MKLFIVSLLATSMVAAPVLEQVGDDLALAAPSMYRSVMLRLGFASKGASNSVNYVTGSTVRGGAVRFTLPPPRAGASVGEFADDSGRAAFAGIGAKSADDVTVATASSSQSSGQFFDDFGFRVVQDADYLSGKSVVSGKSADDFGFGPVLESEKGVSEKAVAGGLTSQSADTAARAAIADDLIARNAAARAKRISRFNDPNRFVADPKSLNIEQENAILEKIAFAETAAIKDSANALVELKKTADILTQAKQSGILVQEAQDAFENAVVVRNEALFRQAVATKQSADHITAFN